MPKEPAARVEKPGLQGWQSALSLVLVKPAGAELAHRADGALGAPIPRLKACAWAGAGALQRGRVVACAPSRRVREPT